MDNENWATLYTQEYNSISGHGIWHYLIDTAIGQIHVVEYEGQGMEIIRQIYDSDNDKAEKLFKRISCQMLNGKF